jgi:hypothetical protein
MCLRYQFCSHQRVCILHFLKKVKFVVPFLWHVDCLELKLAFLFPCLSYPNLVVPFLAKFFSFLFSTSSLVFFLFRLPVFFFTPSFFVDFPVSLTIRVSTEFRRQGIPSVFFTSVYSVFRAELAAIPAEFRRILCRIIP